MKFRAVRFLFFAEKNRAGVVYHRFCVTKRLAVSFKISRSSDADENEVWPKFLGPLRPQSVSKLPRNHHYHLPPWKPRDSWVFYCSNQSEQIESHFAPPTMDCFSFSNFAKFCSFAFALDVLFVLTRFPWVCELRSSGLGSHSMWALRHTTEDSCYHEIPLSLSICVERNILCFRKTWVRESVCKQWLSHKP